jgi:hypothetical protein
LHIHRAEAAIRPQQRQETFLHDVVGIGHRAGKTPGESEERNLVLVQEPQERPFLAPFGVASKVLGGPSHV